MKTTRILSILSVCAVNRNLRLLGLGLVLMGCSACGTPTPQRMNTFYPQPGDEHRHPGTISSRNDFRDDEADISQSHTDARQGLNFPGDMPGVANDGTGWTGYR